MKKFLKIILTCFVFLLAFAACKNKPQEEIKQEETIKPKVYVSIYPLYDFTKKIAGDKVDLSLIIPNGQEPHDWEPSQDDIKKLENANLFIYNGAGLESWTEKVLEALDNKKIVSVEAAKGVKLLEIEEEHDHHHNNHKSEDKAKHKEEHDHHEHEGIDPHVWLSPLNAMIEADNIAEGLITVDPQNEAYYKENLEKFKNELLELDKMYKEKLNPLPNKTIVVSHEAYGYLCNAYDLEQVGIERVNAETEPDAKTISEIIDLVKEKKITTIFTEELIETKIAETIAAETGAKTEFLNPIESISEEEQKENADYIIIMKNNLKKLVEALK